MSSHCEVLPNLFRLARKFCAGHVILLADLGMIHRQAVSVAQFFFSEIVDIAFLDHIKMMAVTVALI